ncbi:stage II sporulation protein D [Paenibacillus harenae]|uniref:Stage II sporulation protein D n=1 Tax=Paenibacillus harenae TaxID=306543 RepID=A0ABT9U326_PAEHA|nr:stage II sporulation protein D [Paenibacillus harenae]MDQ0113622.1 stage II sporulation protein D [Paenibacillus harenae]
MSRGKRTQLVVSLLRRHTVKRWLALFGIGAMLGASILLIKLSLNELRSVPAASYAESETVESQGTSVKEKTASRITETAAQLRQAEPDEKNDVNVKERNEPQQEDEKAAAPQTSSELDGLIVHVYLTKEKRIENVPLETYVRGVVAAEMPIDFELEALKAQAIAARTYIVRRLMQGEESDASVHGADVTDTIQHQVYTPLAKLEGQWTKAQRKANMAKLGKAIDETRGLVVTYEGEPIEAVFFSTSNGYTENSEDYWKQQIPYLRSVESPWDKAISPKYKETVSLKLSEFHKKLGVKRKGFAKSSLRIIERTEGNRISKIRIGDKVFTGREVREKLELASSQFTWSVKGDYITITTYGYGHGVGMSQWGANGMAKEGAGAASILAHYYSSTAVEQASKLSAQLAQRS